LPDDELTDLLSEADYTISRYISEEEACELIEDVEKFLARLKEAISNSK
jgi:uncharacterized protein (UPF0332 family)